MNIQIFCCWVTLNCKKKWISNYSKLFRNEEDIFLEALVILIYSFIIIWHACDYYSMWTFLYFFLFFHFRWLFIVSKVSYDLFLLLFFCSLHVFLLFLMWVKTKLLYSWKNCLYSHSVFPLIFVGGRGTDTKCVSIKISNEKS